MQLWPNDNLLDGAKSVVISYASGATLDMIEGSFIHVKYNTGDSVWWYWNDGEYKVHVIDTHDGKHFRYE